jgi:(1->4)-alpha-D-glucan 1-alpha-D-glucosylmutase
MEVWNFSLVDPDNRRPVDFEECRSLLASLSEASPIDLLRDWPSGRIKLAVTQKLMHLRREFHKLFELGSYEPLECIGYHAHRLIAFLRTTEHHAMVTVVPRLTNRMGFPSIGNVWRDTRVSVPAGEWREVFTGRTVISDDQISVADAMSDFPMVVLVRSKGSDSPEASQSTHAPTI